MVLDLLVDICNFKSSWPSFKRASMLSSSRFVSEHIKLCVKSAAVSRLLKLRKNINILNYRHDDPSSFCNCISMESTLDSNLTKRNACNALLHNNALWQNLKQANNIVTKSFSNFLQYTSLMVWWNVVLFWWIMNTWSRRNHGPHNPATRAKVSRSLVALTSHSWPGNFGTRGWIMWSCIYIMFVWPINF